MKNIILILLLTLLVVSCGEETTEDTCSKGYHQVGDKCIHDAIDCSSMPGTFDNGNGDCVTPCNNTIDCGEGGSCKATAFDAYICECTAPNTLGEDKICHAPLNFTDNKCYNEIVDTLVPIDKVATTPTTFDCKDGVCDVTLDATAGGMSASHSNPWVYLSLKDNKILELNDNEAFNSQDWDLAFKRTLIRSNSEDSGIGTVEVAKADGVDFDTTTELPTKLDQDFIGDKFMDSGCVVIAGTGMSALNTAFDNWFDMKPDADGKHRVYPKDSVYFIKVGDTTYKLKFIEYNNDKRTDGQSQGIYTLKYSALN